MFYYEARKTPELDGHSEWWQVSMWQLNLQDDIEQLQLATSSASPLLPGKVSQKTGVPKDAVAASEDYAFSLKSLAVLPRKKSG